jgi:hypothetical protein
VIKVRRGLYIEQTNSAISLKPLENKINGLSYISFEFALAYSGLIPELVLVITSAMLKIAWFNNRHTAI